MLIYDVRVPRPGRYDEYGVPREIAESADCLLRHRNTCTDPMVFVIDAALLRLLAPWVRSD